MTLFGFPVIVRPDMDPDRVRMENADGSGVDLNNLRLDDENLRD